MPAHRCLSDPGYLLVRAVREEGVPVCSVPGASAFTTALAAAGQPPLPATLCGFLPPRPGPRRRRIAELDAAPWTLVILLSPHRLARELADLEEVLGGNDGRPCWQSSASGTSERFRGPCQSLREEWRPRNRAASTFWLWRHGTQLGGGSDVDPEAVRAEYQRALTEGMERREALRTTAQRFGIRRRNVFDLVASDRENSGRN